MSGTRSAGGWPTANRPAKRPHNWHKRTESSRVTGTRRWRVLREQVLRRAGFECEAPACEAGAVAVDHIQPVSAGGDPYAASNCQALCRRHHARKTAAEASAAAAAKRAAPKPKRRSQVHPADVLRGDEPAPPGDTGDSGGTPPDVSGQPWPT